MSENDRGLEQAKLEFDRVKHRDEIELRRRELDLKLDQQRHVWRSPLFLALVAGFVGLLSNAIVAIINGSSERALEREKANATQSLEQHKAEAERILEAIKTGDPDLAAANLALLVKTGLVTNEADLIQEYLDEREPGEGASLPVPNVAPFPQIGGIVGPDERLTVRDASQAPFDSICQIRVGNDKWGSGFLVHPRIAITASFTIESGELSESRIFVGEPMGDSRTEGIVPDDLVQSSHAKHPETYSILILPKPVGVRRASFSYAGDEISVEGLKAAELHFAGFPGDRNGSMIHTSGNVVGSDDEYLYHLLDTGFGTSGGPLWVRQRDRFLVLGVHLSTGRPGAPGKVAVRIDPEEIGAIIQQLEN